MPPPQRDLRQLLTHHPAARRGLRRSCRLDRLLHSPVSMESNTSLRHHSTRYSYTLKGLALLTLYLFTIHRSPSLNPAKDRDPNSSRKTATAYALCRPADAVRSAVGRNSPPCACGRFRPRCSRTQLAPITPQFVAPTYARSILPRRPASAQLPANPLSPTSLITAGNSYSPPAEIP